MNARTLTAPLFLVLMALTTSGYADYLEVSRSANIKTQARGDAPTLEKVTAGTVLPLLDDGRQQNGYYHVTTSTRERDGWIYRNRVRRKLGPIPVTLEEQPPSLVFGGLLNDLCLHGCPAGAPSGNRVIARNIYILSNNGRTKFADWVAYRVTAETIGPSQERNWKKDPLLAPEETLEPADYKDAHAVLKVDRGHQAPLASFSGTPNWHETNYLSNITPQRSDLNQGPWQRLEQRVRDLAERGSVSEVFVSTGPLYEREMGALPRTAKPHRVPSAYWKVVAIRSGATIRVAAFYFDQDTERGADFCGHARTVAEIERRSGLDFFYALEDTEEANVESRPGALVPDLGCPPA